MNSNLETKSSQMDDGHHKAAVEGHLKVIDDAELKLKKYAEIGQSFYFIFILSLTWRFTRTKLTLFSSSVRRSYKDESPQNRKASKSDGLELKARKAWSQPDPKNAPSTWKAWQRKHFARTKAGTSWRENHEDQISKTFLNSINLNSLKTSTASRNKNQLNTLKLCCLFKPSGPSNCKGKIAGKFTSMLAGIHFWRAHHMLNRTNQIERILELNKRNLMHTLVGSF